MSAFTIPELCLVALIGPSGSGKSTLARRLFLPTEVVSSDFCRGLVSDDENSLDATNDAFDLVHYIAGKRLARGNLTVIDATSVQPEARKSLVDLARQHHVLPVAIVLNLPEAVCHERNRTRDDRNFGPHVVRNQTRELRRSLGLLGREGFRYVRIITDPAEAESLEIVRQPLWTNRKEDCGPFDIIGDVHGCLDELEELLLRLGYRPEELPEGSEDPPAYRHPEGRKVIFLGDLVDRGPRSLDTVLLARSMVRAGAALAVPGNHDVRLVRWLRGKNVRPAHGLQNTIDEIEALPPETQASVRERVGSFLDSLVSHYVLDQGNLVVAHAGLTEELQGRSSGRVREFCLYGETTGETDEYGLPIRYPWAREYRGQARMIYGHTPVPSAEWLNRTMNIDTGCVFGGALTALRYPEMELVQIEARREYAPPIRPLHTAPDALSAQQQADTLLDMADVSGKRIVETRLGGRITIREQNSAAALEVMARFAIDPRWLIYLPPTMSPCETAPPGAPMLERPLEALEYYRRAGLPAVICQEKHMGSRAVVVICKDAGAAAERFGVRDGSIGACWTRTGRPFFDQPELNDYLLDQLREAAEAAGLWTDLQTAWLCLDCELMPWSAKSQALIDQQYGPVGAAASAGLAASAGVLSRAAGRGLPVEELRSRIADRRVRAGRYIDEFLRYCWPVTAPSDLRLAPFHLLASEGRVHSGQSHLWHMEMLQRLCAAGGPLLQETRFLLAALSDEAGAEAASAWWDQLTAGGGEGMVVKPQEFIARGERGLLQPAVKCRGPEYLRIIYGPDYDEPANLERLRARGLSHKRSLAMREFTLGLEGLERFVQREPLRRVHECVFAVLALESEPVDPRL